MKWRIYYGDGTTFDDSQGEPWDAPGTGVVVIVQKHYDHREGAYLQWRDNFYIWVNGEWVAVCRYRFQEYIFHEKYDHRKVALMGTMVTNQDFDRITRKAKTDRDFYGPA